MYFSVDIYRKDPETFVAFCSELNVFAYGASIEIAVERLKEIVSFYLETSDELNLSLEELGLAPPADIEPTPRVSAHNPAVALN